MSSISVHDTHLPALSSHNLRKLHSSKVDKDRLLHDYIQSQQAHLPSYAPEGKSVASSWNAEETDAPPKKAATARDVELESGFGTPMLKPRPATRKADAQAQDVKQDRGRARQKVGKENKGRGSSVSIEMGEKRAADRGERANDRDVGDSRTAKRVRPKEVKSTSIPKEKLPAGSKPKEKVSRKPSGQGRQGRRDPESEEEYRNRLAERRERRRAKKAIVDPKPDPPASNVYSHDSDDGKKKSSGKRGKGLNIPAGLALMHGFSATNIGKNRLTLEPVVGVFNKGKASAKTTVKKAKEDRPTRKAKMFSEDWFLDKTKANTRKAGPTSSQSSGSDRHPEPESDGVSSMSEQPKGKTLFSKGNFRKHKRLRSPSTVEGSSGECEEAASQDQVRPRKKHKTERAKSPVWDIELENGQLPSDSHSNEDAHPETETKVAGTLLLDTRAFSSRWVAAKDKHDSPPTGPAIGIAEHVAEVRETHESDGVSTIDPSHSASQVAYRGTTFSRFFLRPSDTQGKGAREDSACDQGAAPSPMRPSSHQTNPCKELDDTVQGRMVHPSWNTPGDSLDTLHQDNAEPIPSSLRALSGSPCNKSPEQAVSRPPSCASSWNYLQEALSGVSRADPDHGGTALDNHPHPEYVSSISLNLASSPLLSPISMGELGPMDFEDQPMAVVRDWTAEFLGLLGEEAPDDLFLSNIDVAGYTVSPERLAASDDNDLGVCGEPTEEEELLGAGHVNTWELEGEAGSGALCDSYLVEEDSNYGVDHLQEHALEDCGSVPAAWDGTPEVYDMLYPRKSVKFSNEIRCYKDDHDMADTDTGEGWKWQPEPGINDADSGELDLSESGDPDGRSAGTSDSDPALSEANCQLDFAVAVEDESSQPEEDESGAPSEIEEERSVLGPLQRFSQGRALLMGVASEIGVDDLGTRLGVSAMEEDVARNLRGHWRPQRF